MRVTFGEFRSLGLTVKCECAENISGALPKCWNVGLMALPHLRGFWSVACKLSGSIYGSVPRDQGKAANTTEFVISVATFD